MVNDINHPAHYNAGKIEVIDFIEDQGLGFNLGNVLKYVCRADHKGEPAEDLAKAQWYLERESARRKAKLPQFKGEGIDITGGLKAAECVRQLRDRA